MEKSATIVRTDGTTEHLRHRPTLAEAQKVVGGYIELVKARDLGGNAVVLVVCEEGKLKGMPINNHITRNYGSSIYNGHIVGDAIILRGYQTVG